MKAATEGTNARDVSRRRFLQAVAATGVAAAAWGIGVGLAEIGTPTPTTAQPDAVDETTAKRQWAFVVDMRLCDGCDKCTEACQKTHYLSPDQKWINVYHLTSPGGQQYHMPRLCMHCENPPCEKVCPVGATFKNDSAPGDGRQVHPLRPLRENRPAACLRRRLSDGRPLHRGPRS
jgi:ferredoxin